MRKLLPIILLCICFPLVAKTHVLPSLEVLGEGQVKIPLGPRGALSFEGVEVRDSLPDFIPSTQQILPMKAQDALPPLRGRFAADLSIAPSFKLSASLYHLHPNLEFVRADIHDKFFKKGFSHQDYLLGAALQAYDKLKIDTALRYQDASAKGYQSNAFLFSLAFDLNDIQDKGWHLREIHTRLWWENSSHHYDGLSTKHQRPGVWHHHTVSVENHTIENLFGTSLGRFAALSAYRTPIEYKDLKLQRVGLMSDMSHILPAVDLFWQHSPSPKWLLSVANVPTLEHYSRSSFLADYHWAGQTDKGRAQMAPLNLQIKLQRSLPALFGSYSYMDNSPQNSVSLGINSSYIYNAEVLIQKQTALPYLNLEPKWHNWLQIASLLKFPWFSLNQSLSVNLEHLPHQNHIRAPYSPIFEANTSLRHEQQDFALCLQFNQSYNIKDHQGRSLPEALSLDFGVSYQLFPQIQLKAEILNLLGRPLIVFNGLPVQNQEFRLGVQYLWR